MSIYKAVSGLNKEIKEHYCVAGGVNKKCKEIYGVAGGVNRKVYTNELLRVANIPWSFPTAYPLPNCQGAKRLSVDLYATGTQTRWDGDEDGEVSCTNGMIKLYIYLKSDSNKSAAFSLINCHRVLNIYNYITNKSTVYSNIGGFFNANISSYDSNNNANNNKVVNQDYGTVMHFDVDFYQGYCQCGSVKYIYPFNENFYPISCSTMTVDPFVNGSSYVTWSATNLVVI